MQESDELSTVLLQDMAAAIRRLKDDHPRERRACIRAIFAAAEGHLGGLCQDLLARATGSLTETERMALREESYRVTESGKIVTIEARLPLKSRVKLATTIVRRLHPEYEIDFGGAGWQALLRGLDVRDSITHPKTRQDMSVEPIDVEVSLNGVFWFLSVVISPGHEGIAAYLEKNRRQFTLADLDRYGYGSVWPSVGSPASSVDADTTGQEMPGVDQDV